MTSGERSKALKVLRGRHQQVHKPTQSALSGLSCDSLKAAEMDGMNLLEMLLVPHTLKHAYECQYLLITVCTPLCLGMDITLHVGSHIPPFGARRSWREGCAGVLGADCITSCAPAPSLAACLPLLSSDVCKNNRIPWAQRELEPPNTLLYVQFL